MEGGYWLGAALALLTLPLGCPQEGEGFPCRPGSEDCGAEYACVERGEGLLPECVSHCDGDSDCRVSDVGTPRICVTEWGHSQCELALKCIKTCSDGLSECRKAPCSGGLECGDDGETLDTFCLPASGQ